MPVAVLALAMLLALVRPGGATDRPLESARIAMTRFQSGMLRLQLTSRDRAVLFPQIGSADDPSANGLTVTLVSQATGVVTVVIPGGLGSPGWTVRQTSMRGSYRYRNRAAPAGPSVARAASIVEGRGIKIDLRSGFDLPSGPLGISVTTGSLRSCTLFDATTLVVDQPGRFVARADTATAGGCSDIALGARPLVWLFGDSITGLYCPYVRDQHPEWEVICMGVGSETTVIGAPRLSAALTNATRLPDIVLIEEGVNDLLGLGYDFDYDQGTCTTAPTPQPVNVNARLTDMTALVRAVGVTPIVSTMLWQCPVPSGDTCLALPFDDPAACPQLRCFFDGACALSGLVQTTQTPWVDFSIPATEFADLLHPTAAGRQILADQATAAITAVLSSLP